MQFVHVTIRSAKKAETVEFYQKYCGLKIQKELGDRITFLADSEGTTNIEVIQDPDHAVQATGISLGFATEDVEAYREQLQQEGMTVTDIIAPNPAAKFFFTKDPNGVEVQFINHGA